MLAHRIAWPEFEALLVLGSSSLPSSTRLDILYPSAGTGLRSLRSLL